MSQSLANKSKFNQGLSGQCHPPERPIHIKPMWALNESTSPKSSRATVNYIKTNSPWTIILRQKYWEPRLEGTALHSLACYSPLLCRSNRKCLAPPWQRVHRPLQPPRRYQPCWNVNTLRSWMYLNGSTLLFFGGFFNLYLFKRNKKLRYTLSPEHSTN